MEKKKSSKLKWIVRGIVCLAVVLSSDEIITELLDSGIYLFEKDDLVTVKVSYEKNGIPLPFLSKNVKMPVIISETIRTSGKR